jgi:hypothetical protein
MAGPCGAKFDREIQVNMPRKISAATAAGLVAVLGAFADSAIAVESRQQGVAEARAPGARQPAISPSIRAGVVTRVDASGQRVEIDGRWYLIVASRTQLIQKGKPVVPSLIKTGQSIKFSLAPGHDGNGQLGVIYVP